MIALIIVGSIIALLLYCIIGVTIARLIHPYIRCDSCDWEKRLICPRCWSGEWVIAQGTFWPIYLIIKMTIGLVYVISKRGGIALARVLFQHQTRFSGLQERIDKRERELEIGD